MEINKNTSSNSKKTQSSVNQPSISPRDKIQEKSQPTHRRYASAPNPSPNDSLNMSTGAELLKRFSLEGLTDKLEKLSVFSDEHHDEEPKTKKVKKDS